METTELNELFTKYNQIKQEVTAILRDETHCMVVVTDMTIIEDYIAVEFNTWSDSRCYDHSAMFEINPIRLHNYI